MRVEKWTENGTKLPRANNQVSVGAGKKYKPVSDGIGVGIRGWQCLIDLSASSSNLLHVSTGICEMKQWRSMVMECTYSTIN